MRNSFLFFVGFALSVAGCSGKGSSGGGGHAATGASSSSGGMMCGTAICNPDEVCAVTVGDCNGPKSCQPGPSCSEENAACGCDGTSYANQCVADIMGGGTAHAGACAPPANHFACQYEYQVPIYCTLGKEYCHITPTSDVYTVECKPLPAACGPAPTDCSCLMDGCAGNYCGVDKTTHTITVLCQASG